MKATGIIRRIDDLGRVVIPKELRRSMELSEGDALEIFVDNDSIILCPYALNNQKIWKTACIAAEALCGCPVTISPNLLTETEGYSTPLKSGNTILGYLYTNSEQHYKDAAKVAAAILNEGA